MHPILGNSDRYEWVRGGLESFFEKKSHRAALPEGTRNYAWTLFRPDGAALAELATLVEQQRLSLSIAMRKPPRGVPTRLSITSEKGAKGERCSRHDAEHASMDVY